MSNSSRFSPKSPLSGSPARSGNSESRRTITTTRTTTNHGSRESPHRSNNQTSRPDEASTARVKMEMNSLQRQIDDLDKQLEIAETKETEDLDKIVEDVKENTRRHLHEGADELASGFKRMCENQIQCLKRRDDEHMVHQKETLRECQDNIFRTNRVFREVSRYLRDDWQHLFRVLCAKFPTDSVEQELLILEGEKPIMQPYKALVRWKELDTEQFSLDRLIQVLQESALFDAAQTAREVMFSDSSSYITDFSSIKPLPQAQSSRVAEILASVKDRTAKEYDRAEGGESYQEVRISSGPSWATMNTGPISNSKLLRLSKTLGGQWKQLGTSLGVSDEEMKDIEVLMDGESQKCAFQTLYKWRDTVTGSDESNADDLANALRGIGKNELAADFTS